MNSILFSLDEINTLEPHPFEYVQMKTQYLQHICNNYQPTTNQLPCLQIAKQQYIKVADQVKTNTLEYHKHLNPNSYNTLFEEQPKQTDHKQLYYNQYVLQPQQEIQSEKERKNNMYMQVCGVINEKHPVDKQIKQQHVADLQIIQREVQKLQDQTKRVSIPAREMCRNTKMISKVSGSLLSMYNIYFPEIFDALINDLLLDEVAHLNNEKQTTPIPLTSNNEPIQSDDIQYLIAQIGNLMEDELD